MAKKAAPETTRRWVKIGEQEVEIIIDAAGVIVGADETLEDWIGEPLAKFVEDGARFGWRVIEKIPMAIDPALAQVVKEVTDGGDALDAKGMKQALNELIAQQGKPFTMLPKKPEGGVAGPPSSVKKPPGMRVGPNADWGQIVPGGNEAWGLTAEEIRVKVDAAERQAALARAEVERIKREWSIAQAKEGRGIDAMNAALFPPAPQLPADLLRLLQRLVADEVQAMARRMAEEFRIDPRRWQEVERQLMDRAQVRAREALAAYERNMMPPKFMIREGKMPEF